MLTAGLMLFPGPAMATAFSIPSARLGARFGYRLPGIVGAVLFCAGQLWYITQTGDAPALPRPSTCPGSSIGGAGVGLMIPTLTGAGASSLPPERFATGAAVLTMGRQIGAALGVAVLVAVLGTATRNAADFHSAWLISVDRRRLRGPAARRDRPARQARRGERRCRAAADLRADRRPADRRAARAGGGRMSAVEQTHAGGVAGERSAHAHVQLAGPGRDGRRRA